MMAAADWLEERPQLGHAVFARGAAEVHSDIHVGSLTDLLRGCLVALRLPEDSVVYQSTRPVLWRVADAATRIKGVLAECAGEERQLGDFLPEIPRDMAERDLRCRAALASTLVAGLELAREGFLELHQDGLWASVALRA